MPAATGQRAARKPSPRDYSGTQKAKAEAALAEEQAARAEELTLLHQAEAERRENEVVDYSEGGMQTVPAEQPTKTRTVHPELIEQAEEIEVGPRFVEIRVNSKIEQMVYGRQVLKEGYIGQDSRGQDVWIPPQLGNLQFYDFDEGQRYRVPIDLAIHLDELGYVWH